VVLVQPTPNARYKLGEPIPVEGYLEVPAGASLFEREVYLSNSIILSRGRGPALEFSRLVPWKEIDGRVHFEATIDPPKRTGTYELSVNPPSLGDTGSPEADSATDERSARRPLKSPSVRYRVEEAKK